MAGALCKNTTLKELIIVSAEYSEICEEGVLAFSEMLKVNRTLKRLKLLNQSAFKKDECAALVNALNHNQTLEILELHEPPDTYGFQDPRIGFCTC